MEALAVNIFDYSDDYSETRISRSIDADDPSYASQLLLEKVRSVRSLGPVNVLVDLGCGSGQATRALSDVGKVALGIDLTKRYLDAAKSNSATSHVGEVDWIQADMISLPLRSYSVDLAYSLSTLYIVDDLAGSLREISRLLAVGGHCFLDLGNSQSLNAICVRQQPSWAQLNGMTVRNIESLISQSGLRVISWRSFQILPLWADRPLWLKPLLFPFWQRLMRKRVRGKMLDEWVSSLPGLRLLAFRHLVVCMKVVPD
jgi:ubiquinone/menaquinone biosynthesis C-methylase UbiE